MSAVVRIVIPAHNEQSRITPTLEDYCAYFGARATIVVVANGCTDDTTGIVSALAGQFANLRVIDIPGRVGKGGAIRAGLKTGNEPYVGFVDADHSTSATEFNRLFERCVESGAAGVIGSRWMPESQVRPRQPWRRRIASRVFNGFVRLMLGLPFRDTQCGAKIFTRTAIRSAVADLKLADFAFDIDLLYGLHKAGAAIVEEPTTWSDRAVGTTVRLASTSLSMLLSLIRLRLEHTPLARLPFLEFLAADSIIPVYRPPSVLVLTDRFIDPSAPRCTLLANVADMLRVEGVALRFAPFSPSNGKAFSRIIHRLNTAKWYAFGSHRRYDAVVEVASDVPFILPSFSAKPTYVVTDCSVCASSKRVYSWYRRSNLVNADDSSGGSLVARLRTATLRIAAFEEQEDAWLLHLSPSAEGVSRTIELR